MCMKHLTQFSGETDLLTGQAKSQLVRAYRSPAEKRNGLWTHFLKPNLLNQDRKTYVPLLPRAKYEGSRQEHIESLIEEGATDDQVLGLSPLFCMPLRLARYGTKYGRDGMPKWERPSDRLINAGFWVFTMEVDSPELAVLEEQLLWCRSRGKKATDSPIGDVDKELRQFRDYRGVTAVYGGNKSVHFHFVFDTRHICSDLSLSRQVKTNWQGDVSDPCLKGLYKLCWNQLAEVFTRVLGTNLEVDRALSSPFQARRTPWGIREADKGHILKLEPGTMVRQVVLVDLVQNRAPRNSKAWLVHPDKVGTIADVVADARPKSRSTRVEQSDEKHVLEELRQRLKANWGKDYPMPVEVLEEGGENVVRFRNHACDKNPSTVIRGSCRKLLLCGADKPSGPFYMPDGWTLDDHLDDIRGIKPDKSTSSALNPSHSFLEKRYCARATSKEEARLMLGKLARFVTGAGNFAWIKSIEGIGKTHSFMSSLPYRRFDHYFDLCSTAVEFSGTCEGIAEPGFLAFASRSYDQADEKCREFNDIHKSGGRFYGRVLPSFSKLYKDACLSKSVKPLSYTDVAELGHTSYISAVQSEQPKVYEEMCRLRAELWTNPFDPMKPFPDQLEIVWFTVHSLIQNWGYRSTSRAWIHPEFEQAQGNYEELAACHDDLWISQVVYDEISIEDLVDIKEGAVVQWCHKVKKSHKDWDDLKLPEQFRAFSNATEPRPHSGGQEIGFDEFRRIISIGFTSSDIRSVDTSAAPFGNDHDCNGAYRSQNDRSFYVKPRRWWQTLDALVTVLTTEELLTCIADEIRWSGKKREDGERNLSKFGVYRFDASDEFINEEIPLHLDSRAAKDRDDVAKLSAVIFDIKAKYPNSKVITNGAGDHKDTITHVSAKGSNDLKEFDLFTILQYLNPNLYARLCLIASEFKVSSVIELFYQDELFQSIGRNRGMRRDMAAASLHKVIMSPRLYKELGKSKLTSGCRYRLVKQKARL